MECIKQNGIILYYWIILSDIIIIIGTFDVTDIQYALYNNELCLTCIFINDSQAIGCLVILSNDTTLQTIVLVKIYRSIELIDYLSRLHESN